MRLNRVLLLAATFSMMIFAMVFTISCSGDDGKDGKGCTVEEDGKDYIVLCGGKEVGTLKQGAKGDKGEDGSAVAKGDKGDPGPKGDKGDPGSISNLPGCVVKKVGAAWHAFCDDVDNGVIGGGGGGGGNDGCAFDHEDPYNPHELVMDCPALTSPVYLCGGHLFDKSTYFCTSGKTRKADVNAFTTVWTGLYYYATPGPVTNNGYTFQVDTKDTGMVGGLIKPLYKPLAHGATKPANGDTIFVCGSGATKTYYNPNVSFCAGATTATQTVIPLCTGSSFDAKKAYPATSDDGKKHLYGNAIVIGTQCLNGDLIASCVDGTPKTAGVSAISTAGVLTSTLLKTDTATSVNKNIPITFNMNTHFCRLKTSADPVDEHLVIAEPLCNGKPYDVSTLICDNGDAKATCGSFYYNTTTEFCYNNSKVGKKCANDPSNYDPELAFCAFGKTDVADAVGAKNTDKETPVDLCGDKKYNEDKWKWDYCRSTTVNSVTTKSVLYCRTNQWPVSGSMSTCECIEGATKIGQPLSTDVAYECVCLNALPRDILGTDANQIAGQKVAGGRTGTAGTTGVYDAVSNKCLNSGSSVTLSKCIDDIEILTFVTKSDTLDKSVTTCCPVGLPKWDDVYGCVKADGTACVYTGSDAGKGGLIAATGYCQVCPTLDNTKTVGPKTGGGTNNVVAADYGYASSTCSVPATETYVSATNTIKCTGDIAASANRSSGYGERNDGKCVALATALTLRNGVVYCNTTNATNDAVATYESATNTCKCATNGQTYNYTAGTCS